MTRWLTTFAAFAIVLSSGFGALAEPDYSRRPVLMIHGYFPVNAADWVTWGRFRNKLIDDGWPEEYIMTPVFEDTTGCDPAHAREISAWVDELIEKTGWDKIDIIAHSEGGLNTLYYLKYFCGVHKVRNFVGLAIAVHGTRVACVDFVSCGAEEMCIPSEKDGGWRENTVLAALNQCDETPGDIRYTSIWSDYDEIIRPPSGSMLAGARNIELETPFVEHGAIFLVNESFGYILDALKDKNGYNTDGPGWDCIPQCVLPDTADRVEPPPESIEIVEVPEDVISAEKVEEPSAEVIADDLIGDEVNGHDGYIIVPWDPGQAGRDNDNPVSDNAGDTETAIADQDEPETDTEVRHNVGGGCSATDTGTKTPLLLLTMLLCLITRFRARKAS